MAYNHSRKAGNRGDVWKHFILLTALADLLASNRKRLYRESHAGAPTHTLPAHGDWLTGIGDVLPPPAELASHNYFRQFPKPLQPGSQYPSSWVQSSDLAAKLHCELDLELYDTSKDVQVAIADYPARSARFSPTDGFAALRGSPPADFTLIDPPFVSASDWTRVSDCIVLLLDQNAPFMVWYPISRPTRPNALVARAGTVGFEVVWKQMGSTPSRTMKGCGVVVDAKTSASLASHTNDFNRLACALGGELVLRKPAFNPG